MARAATRQVKSNTENKELPKIDVPIYSLKIPSTQELIKVRPFTVKEEKLLLMAVESKDINYIIDTTIQIINNCIVEGSIQLDKLPFFDIDYIFIFLRAKSIGEYVDVVIRCNNMVEDKKCGNTIETIMDISDCDIIVDNTISNDIKLDNVKGVKMKYPTYNVVKRLDDEKNEIDKKLSLIINSIDYIYDKSMRYSSKDFSKEELKKFVEDLTEENFNKLENFVDNFPSFVVNIKATCNKCGYKHNVRYSDFYDFFT